VKSKAYYQGYNAVWEWPEEAPRNPYDADTQPDQYGEWENAAREAGLYDLYIDGLWEDVWEAREIKRKLHG